MPAFKVVMPLVDHRICVRHLYANFRDIGEHRELILMEQLWAAASSYTEYEFTENLEELKRINKDACEFFNKVDLSTQSRA